MSLVSTASNSSFIFVTQFGLDKASFTNYGSTITESDKARRAYYGSSLKMLTFDLVIIWIEFEHAYF